MNLAKRVADLKAGGWTIDLVQRVQYAAPSSPSASDNGYWYVLASCF